MKISTDTRTIQAGDYFIPIKGPHFDGRQFIGEAIAKGGRILDVDLTAYAKQYRKKLTCPVIAITGSAGKTTTKDLLYAILSKKFKVSKTLENQNNEIGVPLTLLRTAFDDDMVLVELGMRGLGEIQWLTRMIRPTHVIVTNIGLAHIERLKSQKNIAKAKSEIFLPALQWETPERYAFLNFNTPHYDFLHKRAQKSGYIVLPFGGDTSVDQSINLCYQVAQHFGLNHEDIDRGIHTFESSAHRLKHINLSHFMVIDDTYNANPDGVRYALEHVRRFTGRKILVLGDMLELGEFSLEAHKQLEDAILNAGISLLATLGQWSAHIAPPIERSHFTDKTALNAFLRQEIKSGDIVLIKGSRGIKLEETVDYLCQHFR